MDEVSLFSAGHAVSELEEFLVLFLTFHIFDFAGGFLVGLEKHWSAIFKIV